MVLSKKIQKCIDRLEQSKKLFAIHGFTNSIQQIDNIIKELKGSVNLTSINQSYKTLQTSFRVQYNKTNHRIQVNDFYTRRYRIVSQLNFSGFTDEKLDKEWAKMIANRGKARKVIYALDAILKKGVKTNFDRVVSVSYLYLSMIDGIYGKNLKEFVILQSLSKFSKVDLVKLRKMDLKKIREFFKGVYGSSCLFDGYNDVIRNAVAHSSFWYDDKKKLIIFEDRHHEERTEKITIVELIDMAEKLSDIDEIVFYSGEMQIINLELIRAGIFLKP